MDRLIQHAQIEGGVQALRFERAVEYGRELRMNPDRKQESQPEIQRVGPE
jgi:hypothetical protein